MVYHTKKFIYVIIVKQVIVVWEYAMVVKDF